MVDDLIKQLIALRDEYKEVWSLRLAERPAHEKAIRDDANAALNDKTQPWHVRTANYNKKMREFEDAPQPPLKTVIPEEYYVRLSAIFEKATKLDRDDAVFVLWCAMVAIKIPFVIRHCSPLAEFIAKGPAPHVGPDANSIYTERFNQIMQS